MNGKLVANKLPDRVPQLLNPPDNYLEIRAQRKNIGGRLWKNWIHYKRVVSRLDGNEDFTLTDESDFFKDTPEVREAALWISRERFLKRFSDLKDIARLHSHSDESPPI